MTSLIYKLFGKPQSFEELLDKAWKNNARKLKLALAEDIATWAHGIKHPDVNLGASFTDKHFYWKYHLIAHSSKIYYVEHIGDIPFYSNLGFKLAEKTAVEVKAINLAIKWRGEAAKKGISLKLPFNPDDREKAISDLKIAKVEYEEMGLKYHNSKNHSAFDAASNNAVLRLAMPEEYAQLQQIFNQPLF